MGMITTSILLENSINLPYIELERQFYLHGVTSFRRRHYEDMRNHQHHQNYHLMINEFQLH